MSARVGCFHKYPGGPNIVTGHFWDKHLAMNAWIRSQWRVCCLLGIRMCQSDGVVIHTMVYLPWLKFCAIMDPVEDSNSLWVMRCVYNFCARISTSMWMLSSIISVMLAEICGGFGLLLYTAAFSSLPLLLEQEALEALASCGFY